jgi:hypothetical protein
MEPDRTRQECRAYHLRYEAGSQRYTACERCRWKKWYAMQATSEQILCSVSLQFRNYLGQSQRYYGFLGSHLDTRIGGWYA